VSVIGARITARDPAGSWSGRRVVAFAGIGRPQKFFETLAGLGADMVGCIAFPDHHPYTAGQIIPMLEQAAKADAIAVTTAKDWVRLPAPLARRVEKLPVRLAWDRPADERAILALLQAAVAR
jgi:tetraacyldisaccharide 4'-kinase